MSVTSINTNLAAYYAQQNISTAQDAVTESVARLSSGNAIQRASDNVAGLAIGTTLATNVATLQVAEQNVSQGSSLLQVANGALQQITNILQRQQELATQAASGSLTDTERGFLDQEFQALSTETDSLVGQTNFNGLNLIDGTLSDQAGVTTTSTQATAAQATLNFNTNPTTGQTVIMNGVTLTAGTDFTIGSSVPDTVANLATVLNDPSSDTNLSAANVLALSQANYSADGSTLTVTSRTGGALGNAFQVSMAGTATASGGASIGAQYGGSYNSGVFGAGFTSATSAIATSGSTSSAVPFKSGDTLTALVGSGGPKSLYTVQNNDTLQDIINGVNASSATTGVSATLTYNAGTSTYNMRLNYNNSSSNIDFFTGANYNGSTTHSITNASSTVNLLSAAASSATAVLTTPTAASPLAAGAALTATIGTRSVTLATAAQMTTGLTFTQLATAINANSATTGVTAAVSGNNVTLTVLDPTSTATTGSGQAITLANTGFFQNSSSSTSYLNNQYTSFNLFTAGATGVQASATPGTSTDPIAAGDTLTFETSDGKTISATVGAAGAGFASTVTALNAAAHTAGDNNVQFVQTGSAGNLNIQAIYINGSAETTPVYFSANAGANADNAVISASSASTANYAVGQANTAADTHIVNSAVYGLAGGENNGLGIGNTSVSGVTGDSILTGLVQNAAEVQLSIPEIDSSDLDSTLAGQTLTIGGDNSGSTVNGQTFTFVAATPVSPDQIEIGSTLQQTLDNAVSTINAYATSGAATGNTASQLGQMQISRDGNSLVFAGKDLSNVTDLAGYDTGISTSISTATVSNSTSGIGQLNNASFGGINASGVSNSAFTGSISGFTATYDSANKVDLSVKVGNYTYTAAAVNTNPTSNTTVRFYSNTATDGSNGGYFDIQMAANEGQAVASQSDANQIANGINAAFSSLSFSQEHNISSYSGTQTIVAGGTVIGSLVGSSVAAQLPSFANTKISDITVTAPTGSNTNAQISLNIGGETFQTAPTLGTQLGANQTYRLVSTTNANDYVDFSTGNSSIDLSSSANAQAVQSALSQAFGASGGSSALSFQVGSSASDTLQVSIANVSTSALFNGQSLDLKTQGDAQTASNAIATAINSVTAVQANVGALEESFNYAAANLTTSVQNQQSASSQFLDTDIASESTNFATEQVKLQAGISTLAQANQQLQNLLKLLG